MIKHLKILICQPIFAPNEEMLEKNIESVKSIINLSSGGIDVTYRIGGWVRDDKLWRRFISEVNKLPLKFSEIKRFDTNCGKAKVVNYLSKDINNFDYILTFDSDIIFKRGVDYLKRLTYIADCSDDVFSKQFGMLALNQEVCNCHIMDHMRHEVMCGDEKLHWNDDGGGIAGGCLFVSASVWSVVGGYRVMGVYAGDDAYLFMDVKRSGYSFGLVSTISVIHPHERNQEYNLWKVKVCQRDSNGVDRADIDGQITEANKFWDIK